MIAFQPKWLREYRTDERAELHRKNWHQMLVPSEDRLLRDRGFNNHGFNDGSHISPFDEGRIDVGTANLTVKLLQGVDEESFKRVLSRTLRATTGVSPDEPYDATDWEEMAKGGLQSALETQTIVFEITGASRALTHQLVRSRRAGFHQQSQRATWYGDRPNFRMPSSIVAADDIRGRSGEVEEAWRKALLACWDAYKVACDSGVSYQDARYILPEGTTNYIVCEYTIREFINVFAYRGCSGFLWEMVTAMRRMREVLLEAHPFLEPYVKISCEKTGTKCKVCDGTGKVKGSPMICCETEESMMTCEICLGQGVLGQKCTFQGWENVEGFCDLPWGRQSNRTFLPKPKLRIGVK